MRTNLEELSLFGVIELLAPLSKGAKLPLTDVGDGLAKTARSF
jgi:hypothetical protein